MHSQHKDRFVRSVEVKTSGGGVEVMPNSENLATQEDPLPNDIPETQYMTKLYYFPVWYDGCVDCRSNSGPSDTRNTQHTSTAEREPKRKVSSYYNTLELLLRNLCMLR